MPALTTLKPVAPTDRPDADALAAAPPLVNALTVDVEDYYHVSAFDALIGRDEWPSFPSRLSVGTARILDLLAAASARATFFVLGWVADNQPSLVREIAAAGHEIGCHSYWHRLVYTQTPDEFRADLRRARDTLEQTVGRRVTAYRAPSFSVTHDSLWAFDVLIEEGFTVDSSVYPTYHDRYGLRGAPNGPYRIERPSGSLWELPMPVYRACGYPLPVGGGGYLRLYPYWLTRHCLRSLNARGQPFVSYVHPWELDPGQPRVAGLGPGRRFRHYVGLRRTERRLARLVRDFAVGTVSDLVQWASARESETPQRQAA